MSSHYSKQYLSSSDLKMLDGVLESAGMKNFGGEAHQALRMRAARFLIEQFQKGDTSPTALLERLNSVDFEERAAKAQANAMNSVAGESGKVRSSEVFVRDDYEKRFERDKTWTVIESASGKPARYGSWIMRGLSFRSADRVLRTLNIQSGGQHAA